MFFLVIFLGFLYLIGLFGTGTRAGKIRAAFEWAFIKIGFVKVDGKAGG